MMWARFFKQATTRTIVQGATGALLCYSFNNIPLISSSITAFLVAEYMADNSQPKFNSNIINIDQEGQTIVALMAHMITVQSILTANMEPVTAFLMANGIMTLITGTLAYLLKDEEQVYSQKISPA